MKGSEEMIWVVRKMTRTVRKVRSNIKSSKYIVIFCQSDSFGLRYHLNWCDKGLYMNHLVTFGGPKRFHKYLLTLPRQVPRSTSNVSRGTNAPRKWVWVIPGLVTMVTNGGFWIWISDIHSELGLSIKNSISAPQVWIDHPCKVLGQFESRKRAKRPVICFYRDSSATHTSY